MGPGETEAGRVHKVIGEEKSQSLNQQTWTKAFQSGNSEGKHQEADFWVLGVSYCGMPAG